MKNFLKSYNIFTVIFLLFVVLVIICPPIYGVGDLAEYTSIFESVGLYNATADTYAITQNYGITEAGLGSKSFFEMFLMSVISLNKLLFSNSVFNIHFLSGIYSIVFILGMYYLQKNMQFKTSYLNYAFSALLGIVFLDLGYIAYLNSFYTDAAILVLTISMTALAISISKNISLLKLILFTACTGIIATMRFSFSVMALCIAVILCIVAWSFKSKKRYKLIICSAVIGIISVFSMLNPYIPARDIKLYNLICEDLAVTDENALQYFNVQKVDSHSIEDMSNAVKDVTYVDVVRYYGDNPKTFTDNLKSAVNNSYFLIHSATYFEANANYGIRAFLPLKLWSYLKRTILPQGIWVVLGLIIAYGAVALFEYAKARRSKNKHKMFVSLFAFALPIGAVAELIGTVVTTGKILISKNMIGFGIYFDLIIITSILWGASTLIDRNKNIKDKYGVNQ